MIEATCAACGTLNRVAEADVPAGAKFVSCTSCKARVALPGGPAIPGPAKGTVMGGGLPPKIPSIPGPGGMKPPSVPASIPAIPSVVPPVAAGPKAVLPAKPLAPQAPKPTGNTNDIIDLADLPAPKRTSALGDVASRPAPKSGLSAADDADLPAPKSRATPSPLAAAAPSVPGSGAIDLDDLLAPVGGGKHDIVDLPAPRSGLADLPAPKAKGPAGLADLPAPKAKGPAGIVDLPAPKLGGGGIVDLPAPKGGITDLPAPKLGGGGIVDLPAPKGGITDLPAPKATGPDLPAPKGFFDDLPAPSKGGGAAKPDLPAPKGFFDDLPGPSTSANAPGEIAPKGFFDDFPQPSRTASKADLPAPKAPAAPDLVAPKGFFDDIEPPPAAAKPAPTAKPAAPKKGFFDDIEPGLDLGDPIDVPTAIPAPHTPPPPSTAPASKPIDAPVELDLELAPPAPGGAKSGGLELAIDPPAKKPAPAAAEGFDDLDLSSPTAPPPPKAMDQGRRAPGAGISNSGIAAAQPAAVASGGPANAGADLSLELEEPRDREKQEIRKTGKVKELKPADKPVDPAVAAKKRKILLGAVLGVAVLGGGGAMLYKRHADAQDRADQIEAQLAVARAALGATDANHFSRAFGAANQVLQLDKDQPAAIGIAAEASIAGALDDGNGYDARIGAGRRMITQALQDHLQGPELSRAIALQAILGSPPTTTQLEGMHKANPKDLDLALYLGWGQALKGDHAAAIATFDSLVATPVKLAALYARGKSKLALADLDGATADFNAVLADAREHIGAMVGLAQALPPAKSAQQESDLTAITHRKDFANADPRVRVLAYILLGDDAARGGRLDVARASYRQATKIDPTNVEAMAGLAEVELRDGKLAEAKKQAQAAVLQAPANARAQLATSEYEIASKQYDEAGKRLAALSNRTPPLAPLEQARLQLLTGALHEALKEDDAAVDAYESGAKIAGELDLAPTMAAVRVLTRMANAADDKAKADALRERAAKLLAALEEKAKDDPQLALALGVAYLQSGDAVKAEPLLQGALDKRPNDAETMFQLAKAQARQGKYDPAILNLKKARGIDGTRVELGFELARTYELAKHDAEAGALYDELLGASKELPIEMRGRACVFYGRTGKIAEARAQGAEIEKLDPLNPQGLYCRGEGLLQLENKPDAARQAFSQAVQVDPTNAQYLDAQGRADEEVVKSTGDTKFQEDALRVYGEAIKADANLLNPYLGMARIYVARKEWPKAQEVLTAADKLQPGTPMIAEMMGLTLEAQGPQYLAGAVNWLERAKPSAEIYHHLGEDYHQLNNVQKTIANWSNAVDRAEEDQKKGQALPPWYQDTLYLLGDLLGDEDPRKRVLWQRFVDSKPPDGPHLRHATEALNTSLRR